MHISQTGKKNSIKEKKTKARLLLCFYMLIGSLFFLTDLYAVPVFGIDFMTKEQFLSDKNLEGLQSI